MATENCGSLFVGEKRKREIVLKLSKDRWLWNRFKNIFQTLALRANELRWALVWHGGVWLSFEQEQCSKWTRVLPEKTTNRQSFESNGSKHSGRLRVWYAFVDDMQGYWMAESKLGEREWLWIWEAKQAAKICRRWKVCEYVPRAFMNHSGDIVFKRVPGVHCKDSWRCWRVMSVGRLDSSSTCMRSHSRYTFDGAKSTWTSETKVECWNTEDHAGTIHSAADYERQAVLFHTWQEVSWYLDRVEIWLTKKNLRLLVKDMCVRMKNVPRIHLQWARRCLGVLYLLDRFWKGIWNAMESVQ